jgi:prephenate dehydratase
VTSPALQPGRGSACYGRSDLHAYLGPEGTFTESALRAIVPTDARLASKPSISAALDAVRNGSVADATVPWQNSTAGSVAETIRGLALGEPLIVLGEVVMRVELVLAARPGSAMPDIVQILSHPHALAQAEPWLAEVSRAALVRVRSTASAAEAVSRGRGGLRGAAVCSEATAGRYGLKVIARPSADAVPATTRFVVAAKPWPFPATPLVVADSAHGPMTTSLFLYLPAGCCMEDVETQLKVAGLGDYRTNGDCTDLAGGRRCMCVHIPGEHSSSALRRVVAGLRPRGVGIRFLGGYSTVIPV